VIGWAFLLALAAGEGRPLFYWGARPAVIAVPETGAAAGEAARVTEVHAAADERGEVLRLTFDRPVREALRLPDGTPVSGRLRAVLYGDVDGQRDTGWQPGPVDLRRGADWRLEVAALAVGADPEEKLEAQALVTVSLAALTSDGRRRRLWQADQATAPELVSVVGDWLEIRLPASAGTPAQGARLILATDETTLDGHWRAP
jgi:hypothetical protein